MNRIRLSHFQQMAAALNFTVQDKIFKTGFMVLQDNKPFNHRLYLLLHVGGEAETFV